MTNVENGVETITAARRLKTSCSKQHSVKTLHDNWNPLTQKTELLGRSLKTILLLLLLLFFLNAVIIIVTYYYYIFFYYYYHYHYYYYIRQGDYICLGLSICVCVTKIARKKWMDNFLWNFWDRTGRAYAPGQITIQSNPIQCDVTGAGSPLCPHLK